MDMLAMATLEQIKKLEPKAVSFIDGKSNFIITCNDGTITSFHKDLLSSALDKEQRQKRYEPKNTNTITPIRKTRTSRISKADNDRIEANRIRMEQEDKERKADRPAPELDTTKYFVFSYGCDTGQIYPIDHEKAIEEILNNGLKADKVFRGARDNNRKFPDTYDNFIPSSYVTTQKEIKKLSNGEEYEIDKYSAEGYYHVWNERVYALPKELVDEVHKQLEQEKARAREEKKAKEQDRIKTIFELAKLTGQKQVLEEWSEECDDYNEECDVDNCYTYANPDGTTTTHRNHTW